MMHKYKITLWYKNKKQSVIFPDFFRQHGYAIRFTKKQFDYLKEERYDKDAIFYDYKAQRIYFHEWYEPALTGDCDYAWPAACNYYARVYDPYFVV